MPTRKLLCLIDSPDAADLFTPLLDMDWELLNASSPAEAAAQVARHQPGVGLTLLTTPDFSDRDSIRELIAQGGSMAWVAVLSPQLLQIRPVRALIARHFNDYQTLPLDVPRLSVILGHLHGMSLLWRQVYQEADDLNGLSLLGEGIYGNVLLGELRRAAAVDEPVLIIGEAGTEKELAARLIHRLSGRQGRSFSLLNCSTLSQDSLDCELFGTEASRGERPRPARVGRLEMSQGGTLFLDEIEALSLSLQGRLLEMLRHGVIRRIGGHEDITVDVRLIAASQADLRAAMLDGRILDEFQRRFSVLTVQLTPLRARPDGMERLAARYLRLFPAGRERPVPGFSFRAMQAMREYDWPGNTRELVRRLKRAVVLCQGDLIDTADLGLSPPEGTQTQPLTLEQAKSAAEKQVIVTTLRATDHNVSRTARRLAISRMTLYRLLDKHRLRSDSHSEH